VVIVELRIVVLDSVLEMACPHLQLHEQWPFVVVHHYQLRPVAGATGLPDDTLDDNLPQTACVVGPRTTCVAGA
jgi:hypothetical protein